MIFFIVVETVMGDLIVEIAFIQLIADSGGVTMVKPQLHEAAEELRSVLALWAEIWSYKKQVSFLTDHQNLVLPFEQITSAFR
jgi:hypothetical protein